LLLIRGVDNGYITCSNKETYTGCVCNGAGFHGGAAYDVYKYKETLAEQEERKQLRITFETTGKRLTELQEEIVSTVKQAMLDKGLTLNTMLQPEGASPGWIHGSFYENYYVYHIMFQVYDIVLPWLDKHNKSMKLTAKNAFMKHCIISGTTVRRKIAADTVHPHWIIYNNWNNGIDTAPVSSLVGLIASCNLSINVFEMVKRILPTITNMIKDHWIPPSWNSHYADETIAEKYLSVGHQLGTYLTGNRVNMGNRYNISKTDEYRDILVKALKEAECMDADSAKEFKIHELTSKIADCNARITAAVKVEDYLLADKIKTERILYNQTMTEL
jgi:hypothetical protein